MFSNCNTKLVSKSYQLSRLFRPENLKSNLLQTCQLSNDGPHKTCLYDFHVSRSGKMVDFAGYLMPVQYGKEGIAASHIHTRSVIFCSAFCLVTNQGRFFTKITPIVIVFFEYKMNTFTFFPNYNYIQRCIKMLKMVGFNFNLMFSIKNFSFVTFVEIHFSNIFCLIKHVVQSTALSI